MHSQTIDFHPPAEEAAPFLLPDPSCVFADRALRFAALATDHSLSDWLHFLGRLSQAQQLARNALPALDLPDAQALSQSRMHGMPPLNVAVRPVAWRGVVRALARHLTVDAPDAAKMTLMTLSTVEDAVLEQLADRLMQGDFQADDAVVMPFIGAALQVVFTQLTSQLAVSALQKLDADNLCPCCGSPAVASVVRLGSAINNLRYLHCSLCNSEWNIPRAVCSHCGGDKALALQEIEGNPGPVRAECCDSCQGYLKIVYQDKDPQVDPVADDLASLALDVLVDEAGYGRLGPNLFLIGAQGE